MRIPNKSARDMPADKNFLILALSGGGYRGLYSIRFLEHLAKEVGHESFHNSVNLFTGTSIGGILAIGLSVGKTPEKIRESIEKHGSEIFSKDMTFKGIKIPFFKWSTGIFSRMFGGLYDADILVEVIRNVLGDKQNLRLSDVTKPLVVPSVCAFTYQPKIFRSKLLFDGAKDDTKLIDVARATSAAPTYFAPHALQDRMLIDGGLVANAPDLIGVTEALSKLHIGLDRIYVLSIGTAAPKNGSKSFDPTNMGAGKWFWRGLFDVVTSAQEELVAQQLKSILGERYIRIDCEPSKDQAKYLSLDDAEPNTTKILKTLAELTWQNEKAKPWVKELFS